MLNGKYVSIDTVIEAINRDNPFPDPIDRYDIIEWVGEAMELISVPIQFVNRVTDGNDAPLLTLNNGRVEVPCDLAEIVQVKDCKSGKPLRYSTDAFIIRKRDCEDLSCVQDPQYKINNNHIVTNLDTGDLIVSYLAYPTDQDGLPLVPDSQRYIQAMKAYVIERMGFKMFIQGKIDTNRYQLLQQERGFYMASARNKALTPSRDKMESLKNLWTRLIPDHYAHSNGMRSASKQEKLWNHTKK